MNAAVLGSLGLWPSVSHARHRRRCCCQCCSGSYSTGSDALAYLTRDPGPNWPAYQQHAIRIGSDIPAGLYSALGYEWGANNGAIQIEIKQFSGHNVIWYTGARVANQSFSDIRTRSYVDGEIIYVRLAYEDIFAPGQPWYDCTRQVDTLSCFQPGLPFQAGRGFRGYDQGNGGPQVKFCKIG
jgi:hypothetical protein